MEAWPHTLTLVTRDAPTHPPTGPYRPTPYGAHPSGDFDRPFTNAIRRNKVAPDGARGRAANKRMADGPPLRIRTRRIPSVLRASVLPKSVRIADGGSRDPCASARRARNGALLVSAAASRGDRRRNAIASENTTSAPLATRGSI